eukprot:scaffold54040_cov37-Cyclotella_meneghiniana.AAC.3
MTDDTSNPPTAEAEVVNNTDDAHNTSDACPTSSANDNLDFAAMMQQFQTSMMRTLTSLKQQMEESNKKLLQENLAAQQQEIQAIKQQLLHVPQPPSTTLATMKPPQPLQRNLTPTPLKTMNSPNKHMPNPTTPTSLSTNNELTPNTTSPTSTEHQLRHLILSPTLEPTAIPTPNFTSRHPLLQETSLKPNKKMNMKTTLTSIL